MNPILARLGLAVLVSAPAAALAQEDMTDIRIALGWLRNGQYSALMVADAQGYFAEEGLRVSFIDGGPGRNPIPAVGVGQAEFGVFGASNIFFARLAPDPVDVVAVGVLAQQRPYAYITLADPDDPEPVPADLEGATVGMQSDGDIFLRALAERNGLDLEAIDVEVVLATPEPLLLGNIDYFTGMLHNQTFQIEQEIAAAPEGSPLHGKVWKGINFNEYGVPSYHDVIFTSGTMIETDPELVERFLRAVARGLEFTIENPEAAVEIVVAYPEQIEDAAKLAWRLDIQNPLALSSDTAEHGLLWMNPEVWEASMAFYHEFDEIPRLLPADEVMTNQFNPGLLAGPAAP